MAVDTLATGRRRTPTWAMAAAPIALLGLAALWEPSDDERFSFCPYRRCTGGYCAGCGMTRGVVHALRGDLSLSWHHHPLAVFFLVEAVVLWAMMLSDRVLDTTFRVRSLLNGRWFAAHAVVLVAVWAIRWGTGSIPKPDFAF